MLGLRVAVARSRRLGRSAVAVLGPLAGSSRRGRAEPVAGGQALSEMFACGVVRNGEASPGGRRAARPRRVPLWDDAGGRKAGVHSPCGSTLGVAESSAGGWILWVGLACGVASSAVALQEARRAGEPRRASLWEGGGGQKGREMEGESSGGEHPTDGT